MRTSGPRAFQFSGGVVAFGRRIRRGVWGNYAPSQEGCGSSHPRLRRVCQGFGSHSCAGLPGFATCPFLPHRRGAGGTSPRSLAGAPPPYPGFLFLRVGVGRPLAEGQKRPISIVVKGGKPFRKGFCSPPFAEDCQRLRSHSQAGLPGFATCPFLPHRRGPGAHPSGPLPGLRPPTLVFFFLGSA